jgi:hypothetical protein
MRTLLTLTFALATFGLFSQETATWKGGTPGNETNWNEARNWSTGQVPNEETHVIIRKTNNGRAAFPEINGSAAALWVEIYHGAKLTVASNATLNISGEAAYTEGISLYGGQLENKGMVTLSQLDTELDDQTLTQLSLAGDYQLVEAPDFASK